MSFRRFGTRVKNFAERRHDRQRVQKRMQTRHNLLQQLEDRRLLAGPELIAIRPDAGALLRNGDTLSIAPREFNLLFKGGANLDETSISTDSVRLVRSGGDGSFSEGNEVDVALGYLGLVTPGSTSPADLQQIVFRTASQATHNANNPAVSFPDDTYQIRILGATPDPLIRPLSNLAGEAFNDGTNFTTTFRLNLGAQVVAVVPQPISQSPYSQASDEIIVYFDDQPLDPVQVVDPAYYRLINTAATLSESDDAVTLPQSVTYDAAANRVVLKFATDLVEGNYRLDVGHSGGDDSTLANAIQIGSVTNGNAFSGNSFLGDALGSSNDSTDVDLYEMSLRAGAQLQVTLTPDSAVLNLRARLLDGSGNELLDVTIGPGMINVLNHPVAISGIYFVEVSSADGSLGAYAINVAVTGSPLSVSDNNSTFTTATAVGTLGAGSVRVTSAISPQSIPIPPLPGSEDEPGHRLIQREAHTGATGTTPALPQAVRVVNYYFPSSLGTDTSGASYPNLITEKEKQITREIFEVYAQISGYEFIESSVDTPFGDDLMIGKGDFRAVDPTLGPNAGVAGLANSSFALLNGALYNQSNRFYGDGFTSVMYHEIGHSLGLGHSYDQVSNQGQGVQNDVLPGDHDVVHLQRIAPPNSTDIDMYSFTLSEPGRFTAETVAERRAIPSLLNTALSLYRVVNGEYELVSRNDQYFGADSLIDLQLEAGNYFVGVSSTGNTEYDPLVPDSGFGGTTDGVYDLQLSFTADRDGQLRDASGTPIDGDSDGTPGGIYSFWFQASDPATTIFVAKQSNTTIGPEGSGTLADPYDTIEFAFLKAGNRIVVPIDGANSIADGETFTLDDGINETTFRFGAVGLDSIDISAATNSGDVALAIVGAINNAKTAGRLVSAVNATVVGRTVQISGINTLDIEGAQTLVATPNLVQILADAGEDGNVDTLFDNRPYLVGFDTLSNPLEDGSEFLVPQGVTAMIQAGALFKMRKANLDAGSSDITINRGNSAIQVIGVPGRSVYFRSYHNDSVGGDSDGVGPNAGSGDFGGIVFRDDSDLEASGVFLNYVNHADINNGGGKVFVDANELRFTPVHIEDARPTVSFNLISQSDGAAVSASPDSFDDSLGRIGPDVTGNFLRDNTIDALLVRINTPLGGTIDKLEVNGRFDDTDITHTFSESLIISGGAGGPTLDGGVLTARAGGRLMIDPGVVLKLDGARIELERGSGTLIAEGTRNRPVVITSVADDRYGGSGSFDTQNAGFAAPRRGDWSGIYFGHATMGNIDNAIIAYAGGVSAIEGGSTAFNAIEVHQADVRIANSLIQSSASGASGGVRNGRGANAAAAIYVRGAQPTIISNTIVDNQGAAIHINASSLNYETIADRGRSTGVSDAFEQISGNQGPLIRLNRLENNSINGLLVRGEEVTTESVWDDTDIVHVVSGEVVVDNLHTYGGLKLLSSNSESLVIKFATPTSGFTATGTPQEIIDRIGGTIHVLGLPGKPVVMTSLSDDSIGVGFTPSGQISFNTNNSATPTTGTSGDWRGLLFDEFSNDRNVAIVREAENPVTNSNDINNQPLTAQDLGTLAPNQKSGDENRRLGFEVSGFISPTDTDDVDVYRFSGTAGTGVWIDIDRTNASLDAIVEVLNGAGTVLARSVRSGAADPGNLNAATLTQNPILGGDHYTQNFRDPGLYYVLPGTPGQVGTYFVRVRSNPVSAGDVRALAGESRGQYQLQIRLDQVQEFPGSTVRYADIRFASTGIDVRGLPAHSPLIGEAGETSGDSFDGAQQLVNLLETDVAALGISGVLSNANDVDWYQFELTQTGVQLIAGVNDGAGTIAVVFDIDYADQAVRADTTIAVYDQDRNLVYMGRESNITDDRQNSPNGSISDLSRGSLGQKDPYIGPVHLTPGTEATPRTYYVAVMSDHQLPSALTGVFQAAPANAQNQLVRLEPVNSVSRIVEDHIGYQGYTSRLVTIEPETPAGLFDITTPISLGTHVKPFTLQDVALYVATDEPEDNNNFGDDDYLYTVDPFESTRWLTRVTAAGTPTSNLVDGTSDIQDVVVRSDGRMFGYQRLNGDNANVGGLVEIDPNTGATTLIGTDNIAGQSPTPNTSIYSNQVLNDYGRTKGADQFTTSDEVDALTFRRTGTSGPASAPVPNYDLYFVVRESDDASKLYRATEDGDATLRIARTPVPGGSSDNNYGHVGDIQPAGVTYETHTLRIVQPVSGQPPNRTNIRLRSKIAGAAGSFVINFLSRPNNTNATVVSVVGNTINMQIGGTGNPINAGPSAQAIVDAINNHVDASRLVTAVVFDGNANNRGDGNNGTSAVVFTETIDIVGDDGPLGPLLGRVTGLSFGDWYGGGNLYGVTDAGEFLEINPGTGEVVNRVDSAATIGVAGLSFQGLSLGPQNVEGGIYKNTLFAITDIGQIVAFDLNGNGFFAFSSGNSTQIVTTDSGNTGGYFTLTTDVAGTGRHTTVPIAVNAPGQVSVNEVQGLDVVASGGTFTVSVVDDVAAITSPADVLTAGQTTFTVEDASTFPAAPFVIRVQNEEMVVVARVGNDFTVSRGHNGTLPTAHPDTATVFEVVSAVTTSSLFAPASSTLTSDIDNVTNAIDVASTFGFPAAPFTIRIQNEDILVNSVTGNTLNVSRNQNGTAAAFHDAARTLIVLDDTVTVSDSVPFPTVGGFNIRIGNEDMRVVSVAGDVFTVRRAINGTTPAFHSAGMTTSRIQTTAPISYNATNFQVQAAIGALQVIGGAANVSVTGGRLNGPGVPAPVVIEFVGAVGAKNLQVLTADGTNLIGDEIQRITMTAGVYGGEFQLSFGGDTTPLLPFNADAATVQAALIGLNSIGDGEVLVSGPGLASGRLDIQFVGDLQDQDVALITVPAATNTLLLNEQQTVDLTGFISGGSFTLSIADAPNGITGTSAAIPFNSNAAAVQTAIETGIPALLGNIAVTGAPYPGGVMTIEFLGAFAATDVAPFTATSNLVDSSGITNPAVVINQSRSINNTISISEQRMGIAVSVPIAESTDGTISVLDALLGLPDFNAGDINAAGILPAPALGVALNFAGVYAGVNVPLLEVDNFLNFTSSDASVFQQSLVGGGSADSFIIQSTGMTGSLSRPIGIAFSPLDFNLWHPTTQRGTDAGHGINTVVDDTRTPNLHDRQIDSPGSTRVFNESQGGVSWQFGFEQWRQNQNNGAQQYLQYEAGVNAQYGILTTEFHADLSSNAAIVPSPGNGPTGTYNLPAGAYGALTTSTFDLTGTLASDRPTLYFNYYLDTEGYDGSDVDDDDDDPFRDSARVFISSDGGTTWNLVATNNSQLSNADPTNGPQTAELPGFLSHLSDAGLNSGTPRAQSQQIVQELFDNSGQWRQGRVDLSTYAGLSGLMLRIDFSTAGSLNDSSLTRIDGEFNPASPADAAPFGEYFSPGNNPRSIRSTENQHEGFYIDDIIIGYSERGEMVSGTNPDAGVSDLFANARTRDVDPEQFPDVLNGAYQLEIRRTDETVFLSPDGPLVGTIWDTNTRHVDDPPTAPEISTLQADRNRERAQGILILDANRITDSATFGINVEPGVTQSGGSVPHPGSTINFPQLNTDRLVPGAVIQNNVIAGSSGIRFAGETTANPSRPVPLGRLINNTLVGENQTGTGITIVGLASPTVMNNVIADFNVGITNGGTGTVIRTNFFQDNASNGAIGSAVIIGTAGSPLFVDPVNRNFYLVGSSPAVDSAQTTEQDRVNYLTFKTEVGIPASPINAPDRDQFGQLRINANASPVADRGAIEAQDVDAPYATLLNPIDNDAQGLDREPSATVVRVSDPLLEDFTILLGDGRGPNSPFEGTGVDGLTVDDPNDLTVSMRAVTVEQNGVMLTQGVDYNLAYNQLSGVLRLTPLSTLWEPNSVYIISLDNGQIADKAGNLLRSNQTNGDTRFTIIIPGVEIDFGDAPASYRTLLASDGARHTINSFRRPVLGSIVDGESNAQISVGADGDDLNTDDEDGLTVGSFVGSTTVAGLFLVDGTVSPTPNSGDVVAFLNPSDAAGSILPINVTGTGILDAWIDFNRDGDFIDLGEKVINGLAVATGVNSVRVFTPSNANVGLTYARFRISESGSPDPFGIAIGGEVEDYQVNILGLAAANPADDDYGTILEDHVLVVDGTTLPGLVANDTLPVGDFIQPRVVINGAIVPHPTDTIYRTANGQVRIDDAALGLFTYTPDADFVGVDSFQYAISTQRNEGPVFNNVADFATVTITIDSFNGPPVFDIPAVVELQEDVSSGWLIPNFFTNVAGGDAIYGNDELLQTVTFTINEIAVSPAGLMLGNPDVSSGSSIEFFPAPDSYGTATYEVTATDNGVPIASLTKTFTVTVHPVNDPPRFNPAVTGTSASNGPDDRYQVAEVIDLATGQIVDGRIRYTLLEDNSPAVGQPASPYFIPLRRDPSVVGYNRVGLLDVFLVGPANESDPTAPGGIQTLFLDQVPPRSDLGGFLSLGTDALGNPGVFYTPPLNYNRDIGGIDSFTYSVIDDGYSFIGGGLVIDPKSALNYVELELTPVNDRPQFQVNLLPVDITNPSGPLKPIEVPEDSAVTTISNFAFGIEAAPPSNAFDEVNVITGQAVQFTVNPLSFAPGQSSDFFTVSPSITPEGILRFQPAANVFGSFNFELILVDNGSNDPSRGDLNSSIPVTITINVLPTNDPPVVRTDVPALGFTIDEDNTLDIMSVGDIANPGLLDAFAVGPANEASNVTPGGNQSVFLKEPTPVQTTFGGTIAQIRQNGVLVGLRYTPRKNFVGTDSFIYTVTDNGQTVDLGSGGVGRPDPRIASNTVTIVVNPVNNPPQYSGPANVTVDEDAGPTVFANWATNVLAGPQTALDELASQALFFTVTQIQGPSGLFSTPPVAVLNPNTHIAELQFETAADANGVAVFEVQLFDVPTDGTVQESTLPRTFTLRVNAINDPPTFDRAANPLTVTEDSGPFSGVWATNISPGPIDESNQTVRFEVVTPVDAQQLFQQLPQISDDGILRFIPAANANGTVDLMVTAIDTLDERSPQKLLRLIITPVNDKPTAVSDRITTNEDAFLTIPSSFLLSNDIDPDINNPGDSLSVVMNAQSFSLTGARVTFNQATGQITYDPSTAIALQALSGTDTALDSFTYRVVDSQGVQSDIVTVAVTVNGINDAPAAMPDNPTLNPNGPTIIPVLDNDSDVDGTIIPTTIEITLQPAFGSLSIDNAGVITFTAFQSFALEDVFRYRVADNNGKYSDDVLVTIEANAAPVARDDQAGTFQNEPIVINVAANDFDPDPEVGAPDGGLVLSSVQIVDGARSGQAVPLNDGTIRYIPASGFLGIDTFTYTITDSAGRVSSPGTVQVQVVGSRLQNPNLNADVNGDGDISPIDALLVINHLARSGQASIPVLDSDSGPFFYDVNGDKLITPLDALEVINELARSQSINGLGEAEELDPSSVVDESSDNEVAIISDFLSSIAASDDDDEERLQALDVAFGDLL